MYLKSVIETIEEYNATYLKAEILRDFRKKHTNRYGESLFAINGRTRDCILESYIIVRLYNAQNPDNHAERSVSTTNLKNSLFKKAGSRKSTT